MWEVSEVKIIQNKQTLDTGLRSSSMLVNNERDENILVSGDRETADARYSGEWFRTIIQENSRKRNCTVMGKLPPHGPILLAKAKLKQV